jgi:ABC-type multidrug transport system ATPase subunit
VLIINKGSIVADSSVEDLLQKGKSQTKLVLHVGRDFEKAYQLIEAFPKIVRSEMHSDGSEHVISVESRDDIRQELLKQLVNQNVDLHEFRSERLDLENIFLKLVTAEK